MRTFSQSVKEAIGYYVYALIDPRDNRPFYIGKGKGARALTHLGDSKFINLSHEKKDKITEIKKSGNTVKIQIIRHGLSEKEAFEVESSCIDLIGISNLTNIVKGHYSDARGIMSEEDLVLQYMAEEAVFSEPVILININNQYRPGLSQDELYEITRKHWKISVKRAENYKLACAVYRGIIRGVFEIESWHESPVNNKGRHYFEGRIALPNISKKYKNKSVSEYMTRGSQNPIKYIS